MQKIGLLTAAIMGYIIMCMQHAIPGKAVHL